MTPPVGERAPVVSVVIPTIGRPSLLRRAVDSVLNQTFQDLEVVVVVDGSDAETEAVLRRYSDPRVRFFVQTNVGLAQTRNNGVAQSRGDWVAFLDDDDEWLPEKLDAQLARLNCYAREEAVCVTRIIGRAPRRDYIWPTRARREDEPISEYLFCRSGLFAGEGMLLPSSLLAPRSLMLDLPFDSTQFRHEDWDWHLRAAQRGVRYVFCPEPLVVWHMDESRARMSRATTWQYSFEWARQHKSLMTPNAYSAFLLVGVPNYASGWRDLKAWPTVLRELWRDGCRPRTRDLSLSLGILVLPRGLRERLRFLQRLRPKLESSTWPEEPRSACTSRTE